MQFVSRLDEPSQELALSIDTMEEVSYIGSTNNNVDGIGAEICDDEPSDENSFIEDTYKLTQEDTNMRDIGCLTSPYPSNEERDGFTRIWSCSSN